MLMLIDVPDRIYKKMKEVKLSTGANFRFQIFKALELCLKLKPAKSQTNESTKK